jgi:hypothetical protein
MRFGSVSDSTELETQIRQFLLVRGKVRTRDLLKKFKNIVKSNQSLFSEILKRIAVTITEEGNTFLILKEDIKQK